MVLTSKDSPTRGLVNILSYDLLARMAKEAREKGFKTVIAVSRKALVSHADIVMKTVWHEQQVVQHKCLAHINEIVIYSVWVRHHL